MGWTLNPITGQMEDDGKSGVGGLLSAVLGKETDANTQSNQNTVNSTVQDSTNSSNTTGASSQNTQQQGTTANISRGSTVNTGQQATTGITQNIGTSRTTGTTQNTSDSSQSMNQQTVNNADTTALREAYAKQAAGITPEMLAAIFQQGSKAAPQIVTAQSNALGARGVGNTPVAQALNMLNLDLTSKAADVNRQMLSDSATTAGRIGDLTRTSSTTGSTSTHTLSTQIQDLLTQNDSTSIVNQIVNSLNAQQQQSQQTGSSTNAQQSTGSTSQATVGQTHAAGTQNQTVNATQASQTQTTINKSVASKLAALAAAGVGLNTLFDMAVKQGFTGTASDLQAYIGVDGGVYPGDNATNDYGFANSGNALEMSGWLEDSGNGFADGGIIDFMPVTPLIQQPTYVGGQDADLTAMLQADTSNNPNQPAQPQQQQSKSLGISRLAGAAIGNSLLPGIGGAIGGFLGGLLPFADGGLVSTDKETAADTKAEEESETIPDLEDASDTTVDEDHEALMTAMGITRGPEKGSLFFNSHALQLMHSALTSAKVPAAPQIKGLSNGGLIKGPGTGISDSIPARGPGGQQLAVANNEYILPADVTAQIGVDKLDALVAALHTPAAQQRANGAR